MLDAGVRIFGFKGQGLDEMPGLQSNPSGWHGLGFRACGRKQPFLHASEALNAKHPDSTGGHWR